MIKQILIASASMLCLDGLWLGVIANQFYFNNMKHLARTKDGESFDINYTAAGIVYVLMVLMFMLFIAPSLEKWTYMETVIMAGIMGLAVYGVYDFTNLATLKDWSMLVTFVDMAWGAFLFAATALVVKALT